MMPCLHNGLLSGSVQITLHVVKPVNDTLPVDYFQIVLVCLGSSSAVDPNLSPTEVQEPIIN